VKFSNTPAGASWQQLQLASRHNMRQVSVLQLANITLKPSGGTLNPAAHLSTGSKGSLLLQASLDNRQAATLAAAAAMAAAPGSRYALRFTVQAVQGDVQEL
jgi:hypothetical protein